MRIIHSQADSLLQINEKELTTMQIGLAHRYRKIFESFLTKNFIISI
jgi:hypothetical protein